MNKFPTLSQMTVQEDATLQDAMIAIDGNGQGICFILCGNVLAGVLSDGDIRRALLKGVKINAAVRDVMQSNFISLPVNTPIAHIQAQLTERIRHIPIIDSDNILVDYACASRYHQVPLTQPVLDGNELEYVTDCIRSGWISSQGKYVRQFEEDFGRYVGSQHALAVSNGTVALHLAMISLGIGPGDEVIVPDLTFAAPVNAVLYTGATPVLVDIEQNTMSLNIDEVECAITKKTRAIIPVHLYGHPANMSRVMALAQKYDLLVIEDCAEALGSMYKGNHVGIFGDAAIFSFFGNKTITTGEGGMLLFKDEAKLERARMLRDHGMSRERRYWHNEVGYNYRLTNIQAALGVAQMERVDEFVARKRWIAEQYQLRLPKILGISLPGEFGEVINSFWLYTILLPCELTSKRNEIIDLMINEGVEARPVFYPMHRMPPYEPFVYAGQEFPVSSFVADSGISLPSAVTMNEADIERVCLVMRKIFSKYKNIELASE